MRLENVAIGASPLRSDFTRVSARISFQSVSQVLSYWFDVPVDLEPSDNGNAWTVLMLPLACYFGETLVLDRALDRTLHDNLLGLRSIWSSWFPELRPVEIKAPMLVGIDRREVAISPSKKSISSFSGGIDSLFSFFRHKDGAFGDGEALVDDLLCVGGFNTSMEDFDKMRVELEPFAQRSGRRLVPVLTNIRYGPHAVETPYSIGPWMERLAHAAFLAAIVHLLGRRYREFLIPASPPYGRLYRRWGSHPLCDPLLSSSDLRVIHDGASFTRVERTELVARHDDALAVLHVCWQDRRRGNCSRCPKCLRTMATLDLLGARERATTFDWSRYSMEQLAHVWLPTPNHQSYFADIAERADRENRSDLSAALRSSIAYSRRKSVVLFLIDSNPVSRTAWRGLRGVRHAVGRRREKAT
jgi:hypothetical protein